MNHHAIHYVIGAAALALGASAHLMRPAVIAPPAPAPAISAKAAKVAVNGWGELSQREIDDLAVHLKALGPHEVSIFCADRNCDDLALDFDNAFESAKWKSGVERPTLDTNVGINVGPNTDESRALAKTIGDVVGNRFKVGVIDAQLEPGRFALVISKKPR